MSIFHTKDMNYPLMNGKRNTKEDLRSPKSMTFLGSKRMGMVTPTIDISALKFNFQVVQVTHVSKTYKSIGRV